MLVSNRSAVGLCLLVSATLSCQRPWPELVTGEGVITRDGQPALRYRVLGSGPDTAVVLHGGPGLHMKYLLAPLAGLTSTSTLIFYDQRGRGESGSVTDSTQVSLDLDLEDLDAVRRHFRIDRLKLIGHHWGGAIASQFAVRHPELVERLVLVSPSAVHYSFLAAFTFVRGDSALWANALPYVATARTPAEALQFCQKWWPTYFSPLPPHPSTPYQRLAESMCDTPGERLLEFERTRRWISRTVGLTPWRESLNRTPVPTLVVEGGGDSTVVAAARRWAQHLPEAQLLVLDAPYLFPWVGSPARFERSIAAFLDGRWPPGATKPERFLAPTSTASTEGPKPF